MQKALVWAHTVPNIASINLSKLQDELIEVAGLSRNVLHISGLEHKQIMAEQNRYCVVWNSYISSKAKELRFLHDSEVLYKGFDCTRGINEAYNLIVIQGKKGSISDVRVCAATMIDSLLPYFKNKELRCCLNWNQWMYAQRFMKEACRRYKVPHIYLEQGLFPHTLCADKNGLVCESSLTNKKWKQVIKHGMPKENYTRTIKAISELATRKESIVNSTDAPRTNKIVRGKPVIFIVAQIDSDSSIIRFSHKYKTNMDILRSFKPYFNKYNVIYKPHPRDINSNIERIRLAFPEVIIAGTSDNISSLLDISHAVVTRNSTVGIEALIHSKPVVALADSIYSGRGITAEDNDIGKALKKALDKKFWTPARQWKRVLFFNWLFHEHLWWSKEHEPAPGLHKHSTERVKKCLNLV